MQLSGTSGEGIYTDIDFLLGGTTNTNYIANDKARNVNRWYQKCFAVILRSLSEWGFQETSSTASFVANQQKYQFPTDILNIDRIEVTYDGSTWYRAAPIDRNEITGAVALSADINQVFATTSPYYDVYDNGFSGFVEFYPIPSTAITGGIKYYYDSKLTYLSASGDSPAFAEPFHRILSLGGAYDWAISREMSIAPALKAELDSLMLEMAEFYSKRNKDRQLSFTRSKAYDEYE